MWFAVQYSCSAFSVPRTLSRSNDVTPLFTASVVLFEVQAANTKGLEVNVALRVRFSAHLYIDVLLFECGILTHITEFYSSNVYNLSSTSRPRYECRISFHNYRMKC